MFARPTKALLFRRDGDGLSGGHLKVWHYYQHATASAVFAPSVYLDGAVSEHSPWAGERAVAEWDPNSADALFLAGLDWQHVPPSVDAPVVNLIQGVRHADPDDPRRPFLERPAVRICVSEEVADAIQSTGAVNGPVHVIRAGLDVGGFPVESAHRDIDVLVVGFKAPRTARECGDRLQQLSVTTVVLEDCIPRPKLLELMGRSRVVVTVPLEAEGFFLPPLEAMAMGALVVCPDAVGTRGHCRDMETCLVPGRSSESIVTAAMSALGLTDEERVAMQAAGQAEVERHSLHHENDAFLRILDSDLGAT